MNYEQKYKEALSRAKKLYGQGTITECLGCVFPELKESEDEKIKRELRNDLLLYVPTPERYIAWLEKQNPAWSEKDKNLLNRLIGVLDGTNEEDYHEAWEETFLPWLKSLKERMQPQPKQCEQKIDNSNTMFNACINALRNVGHSHLADWLEKQGEQPTDKIESNPAWSEEDEEMLTWLCRIIHTQRLDRAITLKEESELGEWMDKWLNHNPQTKQSEHLENCDEDERIRKEIVGFITSSNKYGTNERCEAWLTWLEKQRQEPKKVSIWKHWEHGIAGHGEGKQVYLIRTGNTYNLSSCLGFECDYIELSELDKLTLEKQGEKNINHTDIKEKAHQIAWETSKDYDPSLSKEAWCEMATLDMASWLEKQCEQTQFDYEHADIPQKDFAPIEPKFKLGDGIAKNLCCHVEEKDITMKELDVYQNFAFDTAFYPTDMRIIYPTLGLSGEAGEVADKVKKVYRDNNGEFDNERRKEIAKELGDVLWYVANIATDLGYRLSEIAEMNVKKLNKRKENNTLRGSGDER